MEAPESKIPGPLELHKVPGKQAWRKDGEKGSSRFSSVGTFGSESRDPHSQCTKTKNNRISNAGGTKKEFGNAVFC